MAEDILPYWVTASIKFFNSEIDKSSIGIWPIPMYGKPEWMQTAYRRLIDQGIPEQKVLNLLNAMRKARLKRELEAKAKAKAERKFKKKDRGKLPWE